ncbi:hypothetical protein FBZ82_108103 [Azospirillum brasilense]|uniref:DUF2066 domain-containing protein n=1 Tax=Azospirillum brasilense TaxID=192 RepID=A0A560B1D6_AZOBR|nr:hypothetical protein [Azospirillum brasilense]TWA66438.1 hypothetical protein FBZ82_108103 [Azospirillum brasilense]
MRRLALAFALILATAPAFAQAVAQHLFFEAVPAGAPPGASYEARQRLTERSRTELLPAILAAAGLEGAVAVADLRMGGYRLQTNPSLHLTLRLEDAPADRLAGVIAWSLEQESVLVADFDSADGTTGYALVRFPAGSLTPERAQRFFLAAAAEHEGLGGGYTAFGDTLLFLNLRGDDGTPYSGLPDEMFTESLRRAAAAFPGAVLAATGRADARLVLQPQQPDSPALPPLRARHATLVSETLNP